MDIERIKKSFVNTFLALFNKGEMLKAEKLMSLCIPLDLEKDKDVLKLKRLVGTRLNEIRKWHVNGRPSAFAEAPFETFPKFILTKEKIKSFGKDKSILDVGCFVGIFLKEMAKEGYKCTGVDLQKDLMEQLNEESDGNPTFHYVRARDIPKKFERNSFDIVTCFDVLEHVIDHNGAIKSINFVVKPGGWVFINVPMMVEGYTEDSYEHVRMFSEDYIETLFGKNKNFNLETCKDELGRDTWFISYQR